MIRVLDKRIADKIAAGEVIDRPVSIIKELVENSIDAGATAITVEIKNGGKSYIRVTDNGSGIEFEDVELAFTRHATSKIAEEEDLDSIYTLGFRGEALASICAVSRVELITKTEDKKTGRRVIAENSSVIENSGIGCPTGTTITVRDLFYNVPARLKFLSSDAAEARRITDLLSRMALSYPDIKFSLINGSKHVFSTSGRGVILNNIVSIYGSDLGKDLIPVEKFTGKMSIKGFISNPAMSLTTRARQIFCVNGRVISSSVLERGLEKAYKERIFHGRFPLAFLFMTVPAETIDVNVHPTKKEIRFDDKAEVEDFVEKAVLEALNRTEAIPRAEIREKNYSYNDAHLEQKHESYHTRPYEESKEASQKPDDILPVSDSHSVSPELNQSITVKQDAKAEQEAKIQAKRPVEKQKHDQGEQVDIKNLLTTLRKDVSEKTNPIKTAPEIQQEEKIRRPFEPAALNIIGCVFNTYILANDENCFYLIDQHAAHERIFYESFMNQYNAMEKTAQQLLIPLSFSVPAEVVSMEDTWMDKVIEMGYYVEFFGNNTYIVREIPSFMKAEEAEDFLNTLFKEFKGGRLPDNQKMIDRIIMNSCKAAVKGGDVLQPEEMNALMVQLSSCRNPFSCPHGRPVFVKMTQYELEKMFKRIQ